MRAPSEKLVSIKSRYEKGDYITAAKELSDFVFNTYNGWTEKREYPELAALQEAGFESVEDLQAFEEDVWTKGLNENIKLVTHCEDRPEPLYVRNKIADALLMAWQSGSGHIESASPAVIEKILDGTGLTKIGEVQQILEIARDELLQDPLETFWQEIGAGNYAAAGDALDEAGKIMLGSQPLKADIVRSPALPESVKEAFAQSKEISVADIDSAIKDTILIASLEEVLSTKWSSQQRRALAAGERITLIDDILQRHGIKDYESLPERVKQALEHSEKANHGQTEVMRLRLASDLGKEICGQAPGADTAFLKDMALAQNFAAAKGKGSVFEISVQDATDADYIPDNWRTAHKKLMADYRSYLEERNDPAYPATQVTSDYYNAAAAGSDLAMASMGDKVDYLCHRTKATLGMEHAPA